MSKQPFVTDAKIGDWISEKGNPKILGKVTRRFYMGNAPMYAITGGLYVPDNLAVVIPKNHKKAFAVGYQSAIRAADPVQYTLINLRRIQQIADNTQETFADLQAVKDIVRRTMQYIVSQLPVSQYNRDTMDRTTILTYQNIYNVREELAYLLQFTNLANDNTVRLGHAWKAVRELLKNAWKWFRKIPGQKNAK